MTTADDTAPKLSGWALALFALDLLTRDFGVTIVARAERIDRFVRARVLAWLVPLEALVRWLLLRDALCLGAVEAKARGRGGFGGAGFPGYGAVLRVFSRPRLTRTARRAVRRWRRLGTLRRTPLILPALAPAPPPVRASLGAPRAPLGRAPSLDLTLRLEALARAIAGHGARAQRLARIVFTRAGRENALASVAQAVRLPAIDPWTDEMRALRRDCVVLLSYADTG